MYSIIFLIILIIFIIILGYFINNFINYKKLDVAVIVEPRKDETLIKVLKNFIELLPHKTKIQIFHGTENEKYLLDNFNNEIFSKKIILTNLNVKNLTINDYNSLLTSKNFYNLINGENILIFQMDTCLCSKSKFKIQDFVKYDYVGAPWINQDEVIYKNKDKKIKKINLDNKVGNGGLSLRKKSKIIKHIDNYKYDGQNEDVYFSKSTILNFPSIEKASYFSSEHLFNPYSIGLHKPKEILNNKQKNIISKTCPEYNKVFE